MARLLNEQDFLERDTETTRIAVCAGTGCAAMGGDRVREALLDQAKQRGLEKSVRVFGAGCPGFCQRGPVVIVYPEQTFYQKVRVDDVPEIVEALGKGAVVERLLYKDAAGRSYPTMKEIPFFSGQLRNLLRHNGKIDPNKIEEYIGAGGYQAILKAVSSMSPDSVIDEVVRSGLRGRGGAGFSTGEKWRQCRRTPSEQKYLICNRSGFEGNPHQVLEGILICAYAVGADRGYIYMRSASERAVSEMTTAIKQAQEVGLVGPSVLGSDFSLNLTIRLSDNAAVCGEETAVIASIEGERAMPRLRPPFPATAGLWGCPTVVNNAETMANIPLIIAGDGADGKPAAATKIFSLGGRINNVGLVELRLGTPIREIVYEIGGGVPGGREFKALHVGGPSGGCIPAKGLDVGLDYDTVEAWGGAIGNGELAVMDEAVCVVDSARSFMQLMSDESCGKCVPCRIGTKRMLEILERITGGVGTMEDLAQLESLASVVKKTSLCGLGQTAPNPVLTTLRHFRPEYEAHIKQKHCPGAKCKPLVKAPCSHTCPASVDAPSYIALVAEGKYEEAAAVHKERNPFPSICGRVCHHPCETRCRRGEIDEPIAIAQIKRYMADQAPDVLPEFPRDEANRQHRIAVVGGGPAGLSCAFYLSLVGCDVTVYEALPVVGGMLNVGIPRFRLPEDVLEREIDAIRRAGVNIETGKEMGRDFTIEGLFEEGFGAVFLATGAHKGSRLRLDKEESLEGVFDGANFLRRASLGQPVKVGRKTVVIGGGNVALDAARTALRLGSQEIKVLYRRTAAEMPAYEWDIREALEEGIEIEYLIAPVGLVEAHGSLTGVECERMVLGEPDAGGRRSPVPVPGSAFMEPADTLIAAIGQKPDTSYLESANELVNSWGGLAVDEVSLESVRPGVFGGGDAVSGPASVVEAVAHGQKAAIGIEKYLTGRSLIESKVESAAVRRVEPLPEDVVKRAGNRRSTPHELPPDERKTSFEEVVAALPQSEAQREAARCLRCDLDED
jgi:NADH-quinone oxidoreductase subunit F